MQLSPGTLRLRALADTLVIGHRAAFGSGRGLCRLESEDDVRRHLIQALADPGAIDSLRLFWARWQFDTRNLTHTSDRKLIDQVAVATVRGQLAAYVVPDASVKHVLGSAAVKVTPRRPLNRPMAVATTPGLGTAGAVAPGGRAAPVAGTSEVAEQKKAPEEVPVALMSLEERIEAVLTRTPARLSMMLRNESVRLFAPATLKGIVQVLAVWAGMNTVASGFMIEAVLVADGLTSRSSAAMEASEKLDQSLEKVRTARGSRELDAAANLLAHAIGLLGVQAFTAAIWRGANRFTSTNRGGSSARGFRELA